MMQTMSLQVNAQAAPDASSSSGAEGGEGAHMAAKAAFAPSASVTAATTSSQNQKKIALQLQKKATAELSDAHNTFDSSKSTLDASTTLKIKAQFADLDRRMKTGVAQNKDDQYEAARATLTDVLHDSIELNAFIEASKTYKRDFVRVSLGAHIGNDSDDADKRSDDSQSQDNNASTTATVGTTSTSSGQGGGKEKNNGEGSSSDDTGVHLEIHL
jgi:hypothetical protein